MRLINTATGLFEEFIGRNIPKYAILSHTWEEEEVSFSDMQKDGHQAKKGFKKIRMTCKLAADAGIQYVWVDTCCIDKSSSAELTEAINSMYRWYQRSVICYAYLSDLSPSSSLDAELPYCRWFTRGWTLQELIAPSEMRFFDRWWIDRGSKKNLCSELSKITGINIKVLRHELPLASIAVAQRMSWAAKRETTRIEDRSYSLLGLFGVHMPMIYGEEERAFRRLQEEIIKSTLDMSIFAWKMPENTKPLDYFSTQYVCGLLASSPDDFWDCGTVTRIPNPNINEFSLSNRGIKSHNMCKSSDWRASVLPLDSVLDPWSLEEPILSTLSLPITRCGFDQFVREDPWSLDYGFITLGQAATMPQAEYFLTELPDIGQGDSEVTRCCRRATFLASLRYSVLQLQLPAQTDCSIEYFYAWPESQWNADELIFFVQSPYHRGSCGGRFGVRWKDQITFDYTLWTKNWFTIGDNFQFTIANAKVFDFSNSRLPGQTDVMFERQINNQIRESGVPWAAQVVTEIPNTRLVARLSATHRFVKDRDVCKREFRTLEFHFMVVESEKASTPVNLG